MMTSALKRTDAAKSEITHGVSAHDARELRSRVSRALEDGGRLVVDCQHLNRFDVRVVSSLVQCAAVCREHGVQFEFTNMSSELRADLRALQLGHRLGIPD